MIPVNDEVYDALLHLKNYDVGRSNEQVKCYACRPGAHRIFWSNRICELCHSLSTLHCLFAVISISVFLKKSEFNILLRCTLQ